jgi:hypothetical protein
MNFLFTWDFLKVYYSNVTAAREGVVALNVPSKLNLNTSWERGERISQIMNPMRPAGMFHTAGVHFCSSV